MTGVPPLAALCAIVLLACSGGNDTAATTTTTTTALSPSYSSGGQATSGDGFLAIPAPAGIDPSFFGQNVSVTTTRTGRPVVAFSIAVIDTGTSQVVTATYDDAAGQFKPTVRVASGTLTGIMQSVSIARDTPSGTLVLSWDDGGKILAAQSTDDGATWRAAPVADGSDPQHSGHSPSVAAAKGKVAIAFIDGTGMPAIATGELSSATFVISQVPPTVGGAVPGDVPPTAAAAPDGTLGMVYIVSPPGGGTAAAYFPIGARAPVVALDSGGMENDQPSVGLSYTRNGPMVGATFCRQLSESDACTYIATSTDRGATFGPPVKVPSDHNDGGGFVTRVAADERGHGAFGYTPSRSTGDGACGKPKLSVSVDLSTWMTCSPDQANTLGLEPGAPSLALTPNGSLVIAFQQASDVADAPTGVLVVIYPPIGSTSISP
jgi:hypothetical protein